MAENPENPPPETVAAPAAGNVLSDAAIAGIKGKAYDLGEWYAGKLKTIFTSPYYDPADRNMYNPPKYPNIVGIELPNDGGVITINTDTGKVTGPKVAVAAAVAEINQKYGEGNPTQPGGGKKKRKTRRGKKKTRRGKKNTRKSVNRRRQ